MGTTKKNEIRNVFFVLLYALVTVCRRLILVLTCIFRATVSAVSCLVVPAFICIVLLISCALKLNNDDDDNDLLMSLSMLNLNNNYCYNTQLYSPAVVT